MTRRILIYGATGYTGTLIAEHAASRGLDVTVGGRSRERSQRLADRLSVPSVAFDLTTPDEVSHHLEAFDIVLNVAGPFRDTAEPLIRGAIATGTHYLDTTAEFATFALAEGFDVAARESGVMVMPGTGWDVVPTDGLARYVTSNVPDPAHLRIAIRITGGFSRGSLASAATIDDTTAVVRRGDRLAPAVELTRSFDMGHGVEEYAAASMGDLITAPRSTNTANIDVFLRTDDGFPELDKDIAGPSPEELDRGRYHAIAEITGADGTVRAARIDTPRGYRYTQLSSVEVARRAASGEIRPGFQSPASVYGHELATSIADTTITDL